MQPITGAKALLLLGSSITTDHISRGFHSRKTRLEVNGSAHGVERKDFNSYGARRGSHEVMVRGTLRQCPAEEPDAAAQARRQPIRGYTLLDGKQTTVYEAAMAYRERGIPTVVFAGKCSTGSFRATGRPEDDALGHPRR